MKKRKKKSKELKIFMPLKYEHGPHRFLSFGEGKHEELVWSPGKVSEKPLKDGEKIVQTTERKIYLVDFHKSKDYPIVHVHTTVKEMKRFVREAEKAEKRFKKWEQKDGYSPKLGVFFRHLSPELSFMFGREK